MYLYLVPDVCDSNPCQNGGRCYNTFRSDDEGFRCACSLGWAGARCTNKQGIIILFVISIYIYINHNNTFSDS